MGTQVEQHGMVQNFAASVMDEVDLDASRYSGWKPLAIRDRI